MDKNNEFKYNIHKIVYTTFDGMRDKVFVSEESSSKALVKLEEELQDRGYSTIDLDNLTPVVQVVAYGSDSPWVEFQRFED